MIFKSNNVYDTGYLVSNAGAFFLAEIMMQLLLILILELLVGVGLFL
jgi:hypothetical protein